MEKKYIFPKKCCVCLSDCSTTRELFQSNSYKVGYTTTIETYKCSVPVCERCKSKFGRINYGWLTWFAIVLIGAVMGINSPKGSFGDGVALGALIFGTIGLFPSIFIAVKYGHKTKDPAILGKGGGYPIFRSKEYQRLFNKLNGHDVEYLVDKTL